MSEEIGEVHFHDVVLGVTMEETVDEQTGKIAPVIIDPKDEKMQPHIVIKDKNNKTLRKHFLPSGANLEIKDKEMTSAGVVLAKIPREAARTKDITGGLPRAEELFEARRPKEQAIVTEIDGMVEFKGPHKGMRIVTVKGVYNLREYLILKGKQVSVH